MPCMCLAKRDNAVARATWGSTDCQIEIAASTSSLITKMPRFSVTSSAAASRSWSWGRRSSSAMASSVACCIEAAAAGASPARINMVPADCNSSMRLRTTSGPEQGSMLASAAVVSCTARAGSLRR